MTNGVRSGFGEQPAIRIAYYRQRSSQALCEAQQTSSSELREAYFALAKQLSDLAEKNELSARR